MVKRAALIELGGSHDECLYSQLLFLKDGGYQITLICAEELRGQAANYNTGEEQIFYNINKAGEWEKFKILLGIRKDIISRGINTVIFNSAHGRQIRNLCMMPYPKGTKIYGTMHGINKLIKSATQKLISSRLSGYYLLNDYLIDNLKLVPQPQMSFKSYYPIFFPQYREEAIIKPEGELWITIPGQVEQHRRDYETLIRAVASARNLINTQFLFLGRSDGKNADGIALKELCRELGVAAQFKFWDGFVANETFHSYLKQSDIIMPLIHPGNDGYEKYLKYQISGSYNLAFAYTKPLLMLEVFNYYQDFQENAVFYTLDNLSQKLMHLRGSIQDLQAKMYQQPKWSFESQCSNYLSMLQ